MHRNKNNHIYAAQDNTKYNTTPQQRTEHREQHRTQDTEYREQHTAQHTEQCTQFQHIQFRLVS